MKKMVLFVTMIVLCASLTVPVYAAENEVNADWAGPDAVYLGETFTVNFLASGADLMAFEGTLVYDETQMTLSSVELLLEAPWSIAFEESTKRFLLMDEALENPITREAKALFAVTFSLKEHVAAGTEIRVVCEEGYTSAIEGVSISFDAVTYTAVVKEPEAQEEVKQEDVANIMLSVSPDANTMKKDDVVNSESMLFAAPKENDMLDAPEAELMNVFQPVAAEQTALEEDSSVQVLPKLDIIEKLIAAIVEFFKSIF